VWVLLLVQAEKGLNGLHDALCWDGREKAGLILIVDGECDIWWPLGLGEEMLKDREKNVEGS
jgi:hypothetical protein